MRECWIKPNRRPLAAIMFGLAMLTFAGFGLLGAGLLGDTWAYGLIGGAMALVGGLGMSVAAWAMATPKVAYENGNLLVFLGSLNPFRIPIEVVEAFFLGHGPAMPRQVAEHGPTTRNVVIRLAESAPEWHQRELPPHWGRWCGGYIVIHGTWCEPLSVERLNDVNRRLSEIHRQRRCT